MCVAIVSEVTCDCGFLRRVDVDDVQTTVEGVCSDGVGKACFFVDGDVVGIAEGTVVGIGIEERRRVAHVEQAGQVKDLHTMIGSFGNDEGVVIEYLDITPKAWCGMCGQITQVNGVDRVGNLNKSRAV